MEKGYWDIICIAVEVKAASADNLTNGKDVGQKQQWTKH